MVIVRPRNINAYSKCPKRAGYSWLDKPRLSFEGTVISNVIKAMYLYEARRECPPPWKHMPGWIDKYSGEAYCQLSPRDRYQETKNLLTRIYHWYHNYYLKNYGGAGIANVPVSIGIGNQLEFYDKIDIVGLDNKIRIFDFVEAERVKSFDTTQMYSDMLIYARIWGFCRSAETKPDEYVRLVIGPQTIKPFSLALTHLSVDM